MRNADPNPFVAHTVALEAAGVTISLVRRVPPPLKSLVD